jgi:hypothetical protein
MSQTLSRADLRFISFNAREQQINGILHRESIFKAWVRPVLQKEPAEIRMMTLDSILKYQLVHY